jgi:hypothetical protein
VALLLVLAALAAFALFRLAISPKSYIPALMQVELGDKTMTNNSIPRR